MAPKKAAKAAREKWLAPYEVELALRPTSHNSRGIVSSAVCQFCEIFGRECDDADEAAISLPLSTSNDGGARARKRRRKTRKLQHWDKFRPGNIKKHHHEHHPKKWAAYLKLLTRKTSEPEALKLFLSNPDWKPFMNLVLQLREKRSGSIWTYRRRCCL
jgi:hypothetical protein